MVFLMHFRRRIVDHLERPRKLRRLYDAILHGLRRRGLRLPSLQRNHLQVRKTFCLKTCFVMKMNFIIFLQRFEAGESAFGRYWICQACRFWLCQKAPGKQTSVFPPLIEYKNFKKPLGVSGKSGIEFTLHD